MRTAIDMAHLWNSERAGRNAIAAAVANILADDNGVELGANDRSGWTSFEAGSVHAVFADVAHHQPGHASSRTVGDWLFDEGHVAPRLSAEIDCVVIAIAGELERVHLEFVPLFAGNFAGLATNAKSGVG
jgi:hypothetical protein